MPGDKLQATTEVDRHATNVTVSGGGDKGVTVKQSDDNRVRRQAHKHHSRRGDLHYTI